jgi:hypothetical protein
VLSPTRPTTVAYAGQVWGRDTDPALAGRSLGLNQFERHSLRAFDEMFAPEP